MHNAIYTIGIMLVSELVIVNKYKKMSHQISSKSIYPIVS